MQESLCTFQVVSQEVLVDQDDGVNAEKRHIQKVRSTSSRAVCVFQSYYET